MRNEEPRPPEELTTALGFLAGVRHRPVGSADRQPMIRGVASNVGRGTLVAPQCGMLEIVLVEPRIAANTGNIIRLCANVGARLHLIRPLGFAFDDAALRRSGLDYHELTDTCVWDTWQDCRAALGARRRWYATTTNLPYRRYDEIEYRPGDIVTFGCEPTGLTSTLLGEFPSEDRVHIPMRPANRSLNLANAVSIVAYEAWRQHDFVGAATGTIAESLRPAGSETDHRAVGGPHQ